MALLYLLDTNTCIYIRQKRPAKIRTRFDKLEAGEMGMSVITYGELVYGALKHDQSERALSELNRLAELIPVLPCPQKLATLTALSAESWREAARSSAPMISGSLRTPSCPI